MNKTSSPDIDELQATWLAFERIAGLRALKTDADHEHALQLMRAGVHDGADRPQRSRSVGDTE